MNNCKRHSRLLKLLAEHQELSVEQLVDRLHASIATVRRDLVFLSSRKLIKRIRGGAAHLKQGRQCLPLSSDTFGDRIKINSASKRAIARCAAGMCQDGDTVIINGGTTTFMMAEFLVARYLKVLTNSFILAKDLLQFSKTEVMLMGGTAFREQHLMISQFDSGIEKQHGVAKMFMGVSAVSPLGLMESDPLLVQASLALMEQADELIVVADSSKLAKKGELILCGLSRIACLITDTDAPDAEVQSMEREGIRVVTVEPDTRAWQGADRSLGSSIFDGSLLYT